MKHYRILQQGDSDFIVQKKFLWWWTDCQYVEGVSLEGIALTRTFRFATLDDARAFIEKKRPKADPPMRVVETHTIW
jgi:hypothetical protein